MNNNKRNTLGEEIKKRQYALEFSTRGLAKYLGVSRPTLINICDPNAEKKVLRPQTIAKLYNKLQIPLDLINEYNIEALIELSKKQEQK